MALATVPMLKMQDAATLLNVSPSTLRGWERRFGYPVPLRTVGGHRLYQRGEIMALREALQEGLSIAAAIGRARESIGTRPDSLLRALTDLDFARADRTMEAALALGTVEHAVEEALLGAFVAFAARTTPGGAPWSLAARWASDWLRRAQRICPPPSGILSVLVGDVSVEHELDRIALQALELLCVRAGAEVSVLPVTATADLADLLRRREVDVVVLAGARSGDETAVRWTYLVERLLHGRPLMRYRNAEPSAQALAAGEVLPDSPVLACVKLLAHPPRAHP